MRKKAEVSRKEPDFWIVRFEVCRENSTIFCGNALRPRLAFWITLRKDARQQLRDRIDEAKLVGPVLQVGSVINFQIFQTLTVLVKAILHH